MRTGFYPSGTPNHDRFASPASVRFSGYNVHMYLPHKCREYEDSFVTTPERHNFSKSTTYLFREPESCKAAADLAKDGKPTAITVLGSSDNSEPYSYGIAASVNHISFNDPEQFKITALERDPAMHAIAQTRHLVCADLEKSIQLLENTPLRGIWDKCFTKKEQAPSIFAALVAKYPELAQYTRDPVAGVEVGKKMAWYEANPEKVPPVDTKYGRLEDYVKQSPSAHQRQVYVLANSWGYMLVADSTNIREMKPDFSPAKIQQFLNVIQDIKANNQGKEVWIMLGELEKGLLIDHHELVIDHLRPLGLKDLSKKEIKQAGITSLSEKELNNLEGKLWKLST